MFIKLTNGVPAKYTLGQLRRDNPNTSFPKSIPEDTLAMYDVYPYTIGNRPEYDSLTQSVSEGEFEQVDGAWVLPLVVTQLEQTVAESRVRNKRNALLSETDWRFRSDMNPSQEWIDYCQALRDITAQEGFPYSVTWPTKPE
jgi:hypothetical protein